MLVDQRAHWMAAQKADYWAFQWVGWLVCLKADPRAAPKVALLVDHWAAQKADSLVDQRVD